MAKVHDYHHVEELTSVIIDDNNKNIFNQLEQPAKEIYPSAITREEFDIMMRHIDYKIGNELITMLGLSDGEIEVWENNREKIMFCHFQDIDNNIDCNMRQVRNKMTSDYIYQKICEFKPLETLFRTFFTTLI
jgi:hypothetical protein